MQDLEELQELVEDIERLPFMQRGEAALRALKGVVAALERIESRLDFGGL
ncbi:MAG: hypothetical protein ACFB13_21255 [Kiloniellaceae bacterium]